MKIIEIIRLSIVKFEEESKSEFKLNLLYCIL